MGPIKKWKDMHSVGVVALITSVIPQVEFLSKLVGPDFVYFVFKFLLAYILVFQAFKKQIKQLGDGIKGQVVEFQDGIEKHISMVDVRLENMEKGVKLVADNVKDLKDSLENLETTHAKRITQLETDVKDIKNKIG